MSTEFSGLIPEDTLLGGYQDRGRGIPGITILKERERL